MLVPGQQLNIQPCENGYVIQLGSPFGTRAFVCKGVDDLLFTVRNLITDGLTPVPPVFDAPELDAETKDRIWEHVQARVHSQRQLEVMARWKGVRRGAR